MAGKTAWKAMTRKIVKIITVPVFLNAVEWAFVYIPQKFVMDILIALMVTMRDYVISNIAH